MRIDCFESMPNYSFEYAVLKTLIKKLPHMFIIVRKITDVQVHPNRFLATARLAHTYPISGPKPLAGQFE